ncbi:MAG: hypothetical protein M3237_21940 [Actinomycetota bacterium]|nr:hypothetical protein [Actinomycetota bacterium]
MHLFTAIVPPATVLEAVVDVAADMVRNADAPVESSARAKVSPAKGSLFGRRRKSDGELDRPSPRPGTTEPQLDLVTPSRMQLPIANFGNVAAADVSRLREAIRGVAATLTPPTLHLAGSAALEFSGDLSVWARVHGDLETLRRIPPGITRIVEPLGFFVDRRQFRQMLSVATITDATTVEVLQQVVVALDAFEGEPWTVEHVSLRKRRLDLDPPGSQEIARLPLARG